MDSIEKGHSVQPYPTVIHFEGIDLGVKAYIRPRVDTPHVSYDAGNRKFYARPAVVVSFSLYDEEGEDVTVYYCWMQRDREAIKSIILDHYQHPERDPLMVPEGVTA
jgi:hypothetical protein